MFCKSCGKELADSTPVCPFCETPTKNYERLSPSHTEKSNGKKGAPIAIAVSIALLVLIVGMVAICSGLGDKEKAKENTDTTNTTECSEPTEPKNSAPEQSSNGIAAYPI